MKLSIRADSARIESTLSAVGVRAVRRIEDAVMDSVLAIHGDARRRCPVDTGRLRNSIGWVMGLDLLSGEVGTNVEYAEWVNGGTSTQPGTFFLSHAFYAEVPRFEARLAAALAAAAQDAARAR